jgi:hypothetical protein
MERIIQIFWFLHPHCPTTVDLYSVGNSYKFLNAQQ